MPLQNYSYSCKKVWSFLCISLKEDIYLEQNISIRVLGAKNYPLIIKETYFVPKNWHWILLLLLELPFKKIAYAVVLRKRNKYDITWLHVELTMVVRNTHPRLQEFRYFFQATIKIDCKHNYVSLVQKFSQIGYSWRFQLLTNCKSKLPKQMTAHFVLGLQFFIQSKCSGPELSVLIGRKIGKGNQSKG